LNTAERHHTVLAEWDSGARRCRLFCCSEQLGRLTPFEPCHCSVLMARGMRLATRERLSSYAGENCPGQLIAAQPRRRWKHVHAKTRQSLPHTAPVRQERKWAEVRPSKKWCRMSHHANAEAHPHLPQAEAFLSEAHARNPARDDALAPCRVRRAPYRERHRCSIRTRRGVGCSMTSPARGVTACGMCWTATTSWLTRVRGCARICLTHSLL